MCNNEFLLNKCPCVAAKIQAIKKAVTKGDRKRKKESNEEISRLEAELKKRHEEEKQNMNMTDTVRNG